MATAASDLDVSTKVVEEGLTCYICYDLLREPKDLDCPHVYCLPCLQDWVKLASKINCPECRHVTIVPPGGLAELKTNFRLKSMVESYVEGMEKEKSVPVCPNHTGERQHFFCVTCGITVCHNCLVLEHPRPQHEIKDLKVIAAERKAEIQMKVNQIQEEIGKAQNETKILDDMKQNIEWALRQAEEDVQKRFQEIVAEVEAQRDEMIACINETCQRQTDIIQEKLNPINDRLTRLKNLHSVTENVVDTAADHMYLKRQSSLVETVEKLCIKSVSSHKTPSPDVGLVSFQPGLYPIQPSVFGHAVVNGNKVCRLKLITEFGSFKYAIAVATTQTGLLAVLDFKANEVIIYHKDNGKYKQLRSSTDDPDQNVSKPYSVATTSDSKLFISDEGVMKVFSSTGSYEKSWPESVVASRITTTPDDMIVTSNSKDRSITVYQPNGQLVRTHQTDYKDIVALASNGKQIAFTTGKDGKVFVIDFTTGQTLWTMDMVMPLGVCYEQKSDTLLVAGGSQYAGESVIEQYCSTSGHLISRLGSSLYCPYAMTVTHDSKLLVTDAKTVKVYSIQ